MKRQAQKPKRILLKLSGEALQWNLEYGIDVDFVDKLASEIVHLSQNVWLEIVIIIWGWNIFRWVAGAAKWLDRTMWDYVGMMATIMNWVALGDFIEKYGNEVRIMSAIEVPKVAENFIVKRAKKHLDRNRIVVSVAWTGNPYFTTDSAAVLRALELKCDIMFKLTKVDGIYDKDPINDKTAKKYEQISFDESLKKWLRVMDQSAIALAKDEKLPIFVWNIKNISKIWTWTFDGTYVYID